MNVRPINTANGAEVPNQAQAARFRMELLVAIKEGGSAHMHKDFIWPGS